MAGATIRMTAAKQHTLQDIRRKLQAIDGAEHISTTEYTVNGVAVWVLAYEKYYFRTGSYASVTVVLTEHDQQQTACVVASGGGDGMVNLSYGANRNFAKTCVEALEGCGFAVTESDLAEGGGVSRFFK